MTLELIQLLLTDTTDTAVIISFFIIFYTRPSPRFMIKDLFYFYLIVSFETVWSESFKI